VEYLGEHRKALYRYGGIAVAVLVVVVGAYFWITRQHRVRQVALGEALRAQNAPAQPVGNPFVVAFNSQEEKDKAVEKAYKDLTTQHAGSDEAVIANYMLGAIAADRGRLQEAESYLKAAATSGKAEYASLAKLSLSELYQATGKPAEAEKLLRELLASPTLFVSKEQATIALAKAIAPANLAEAQKLLEPLRTVTGATGQAAMAVYTEISKK
jgi:tetratricopeptide (TPR) repeat protein